MFLTSVSPSDDKVWGWFSPFEEGLVWFSSMVGLGLDQISTIGNLVGLVYYEVFFSPSIRF